MKKTKIFFLPIIIFLILIFIFYGKINKNFSKLNKKFFNDIFLENGNAFINQDERIEIISNFVTKNNFQNYKLHKSLERNPNISHRVTEILWPIKRTNNSRNLIIIKKEVIKESLLCKKLTKIDGEIFYCKTQ
tara:strand:+ start:90 stop:488 length:399 start_codon:yes stop_codon:yes gene_type:complete